MKYDTKNSFGKRMVKESKIKEIGSAEYTAGEGISIEDETISIDTSVVATKTDLEDYELKSEAFSGDYDDLTNKPDLSIYAQSSNLATVATTGAYSDLIGTPTIPAAVSGTNDGTNWTSLTIGEDTYGLASGGGSGKYLHQIQIAFNAASTQLFFYTYYVSNSATAYTVATDFLTDAGYTITGTSDTMSRYLSALGGSTQYAIAYREGFGTYTCPLSISSSGVISTSAWSLQTNTPGIVDDVVAL